MYNILILGAGTWGTAIGNLLAKNGNNVTTWSRDLSQVEKINKLHVHDKLTDVKIDEKILFTNELDSNVKKSDIIVFAVPSIAFREVAKKIIKNIDENKYLVSLTKGMENNTLFTMSEILEDELKLNGIKNDKIVVLSGPTHAEEVIKSFPSMIVSASKSTKAACFIQDLFMNEFFRVYTNNDIKGVEICAAFKNVIAIASGILEGLGYGDNVRAATITRGLAEMIRVGEVYRCKKDTFYGLAGIGDMIVTATSTNSRNFNFGKLIGSGFKTNEALNKIGMVVEGYNFIDKAIKIKNDHKLDLPITEGIYNILYKNEDPKSVLISLMTRNKKSE